ncbi:MAG: FtsX-like permease family protein [Coriobacteriia bacterium]|nr:FtsX-like permease family protein [Coriobacteriia bacterium]
MFKNNILLHRIQRIVKNSWPTFFGLLLIVFFLSYAVTAFSARSDIITTKVTEMAKENNVEDGCFESVFKLNKSEIDKIKDLGVQIQENFSVCFTLDNATLRVFKNRDNIDLVALDQGSYPNKGEIVLEKLYAKEHNYTIGSSLKIGDKDFIISGIGSSPDYDKVKENMSDLVSYPDIFGTAFVCDDDFNNYIAKSPDGQSMIYTYAYKLQTPEDFTKLKNLTDTFVYDARQSNDKNINELVNEVYTPIEKLQNDISLLVVATNQIKDGTQKLEDGAIYVSEEAKKAIDFVNSMSDPIKKDANNVFKNIEHVLGFLNNEAIDAIADKGLITKEYAAKLKTEVNDAKQEVQNVKDEYTNLLNSINELSNTVLNITSQYKQSISQLDDGVEKLNENITNMQHRVNDVIDTYVVINLPKISLIIPASENTRILNSVNQQQIFLDLIPIILFFVFTLLAYILGIFIQNQIENDQVIIGSMYALGVKKRNILIQYLLIPILICLTGSILGLIAGSSSIGSGAALIETTSKYSFPEIHQTITPFIVLEMLIIPVCIVFLVNIFLIYSYLNKPCLSLLQKKTKNKNIKLPKFINKLSFNKAFQIGHIFRHKSNSLIMAFGIFVCLCFVMCGLNSAAFCMNNIEKTKTATSFEYQAFLKYPTNNIPSNCDAYVGTAAYLDIDNNPQQVYVIGVEDKDEIKVNAKKDGITINKDLAAKYNYNIGDTIVLGSQDKNYRSAFIIDNIIDNGYGFYAFMKANTLREYLGFRQNTYNVLMSQYPINIDHNSIAAQTSKRDIVTMSESFFDDNKQTILTLLIIPIIVLVIAVYLITSIVIRKSQFSISAMKLFGYRNKEVYKLYLKPNNFNVLIATLISIPIGKSLTVFLYSNVTKTLPFCPDYSYSIWIYLIMVLVTFLCYKLVEYFLKKKLNNISMNDIVKTRD